MSVVVVTGDEEAQVIEVGVLGPQGIPGSNATVNQANVEAVIGPRNGVSGYAGLDLQGTIPDIRIPASIARDTEVSAQIAALVNAAPAALDTLIELATALGNDPNFAATINAAIAAKVAKAGDTMTGMLNASGVKIGASPDYVGWAGVDLDGSAWTSAAKYLLLGNQTTGDAALTGNTFTLYAGTFSLVKIIANTAGVGLNGNTGVAKAAAITQPAGGRTSVKTAIDAILTALGNIGITNAPVVAALTELFTDADIAAANKDGTAATPSLRTLGTGALQAAAGDRIWPGQTLARASYNPAALATLSATSATPVAVDATNLAVTFTVPPSGVVQVALSARIYGGGSGFPGWSLLESGVHVPGSYAGSLQHSTVQGRPSVSLHFSGLTPGAVKTWVWAYYTTAGTVSMYVHDNIAIGAATMEVRAG